MSPSFSCDLFVILSVVGFVEVFFQKGARVNGYCAMLPNN